MTPSSRAAVSPLPAQAASPAIDLNLVTHAEGVPGRLMVNFRMAAIARALARGEASFKVFREFSISARSEAYELLDELAQGPVGTGHRVNSGTVLLLDPGLFVTIEARRKSDYCTCEIRIWAATPGQAAAAEADLKAAIGTRRIDEPLMFAVDWRFMDARDNILGVRIEEVLTEAVLDEAYPCLAGGVSGFFQRYLASPESVLVLQGPPGTGKTRLIRGLLAAMSTRKGATATAMYTSDERALQRDEIFMEFVTGGHDALVIEDADLLLLARSSGNAVMHRFLNIADGIIGAQNRKIIFSTNLRNIREIDEALVRPGRCFAHPEVRELTPTEARALLCRLCGTDGRTLERATAQLGQGRSFSLARVYAAYRRAAPGAAAAA